MTLSVRPSQSFDLKQAISSNRLLGLWKLATGFRWKFLLAFVGVSIAAGAKMLTFMLLRHVVDNVIGSAQVTLQILINYALLFVILALVEGAFTFASGSYVAHLAESITRLLRNYIFDHLQYLSFTYHDQNKTGDLIQRATSDMDAVRRFYSEQVLQVGRVILPFVVNVIALLVLHFQLGLLSIISIPAMLLVAAIIGKRIEKVYEYFQEQESVISTTLQENLAGVRVVKAFARQDYESTKFEKENLEKYQRGKRLILQHAVYWPTADTLAWIQLMVSYAIGGNMAIRGEITVGTFIAFVALLSQIVWPMRNLGRILVQATTGMVSYGRLMDIIREDREQLEVSNYHPQSNLIGSVEYRHVSLIYAREKPNESDKRDNADKTSTVPTDVKPKVVLDDVTFRCEPGQIVALLGSTGSGKTSLVNLLLRFYDYTSGSITIDGVELRDYSLSYLRRQIGIVEQEPFLFSRTIRENIAYSIDHVVTDDDIFAAAKAAAVHDVILSFPKGYDTLVGEKGVTLSGGQKQRVALARTLLKNPRILILDDATSSVDPETEGEIREALQQLMSNRTTFLIAHRIQSVMIADLILVMDKGRIVQQGTHDSLYSDQDGIYRRIYDLQSRIETELEQEIASVRL